MITNELNALNLTNLLELVTIFTALIYLCKLTYQDFLGQLPEEEQTPLRNSMNVGTILKSKQRAIGEIRESFEFFNVGQLLQNANYTNRQSNFPISSKLSCDWYSVVR
jgi:hypothetical protein